MQARYIQSIGLEWNDVREDSYVRSIPALRGLSHIEVPSGVCFFVGENGSGKSSLLEALAISNGLNPEGGSGNYFFSTKDTHSDLHEAIRCLRSYERPRHKYFLRAESFYNVASAADGYQSFYREGSLHALSHGEAFLSIVQEDFISDGLYFLDEPEAALSPSRQLTLLAELHALAKSGAQFFIATHSPILLALPEACIFELSESGLHRHAYEETESYQVMHAFMADRGRMLRHLIE